MESSTSNDCDRGRVGAAARARDRPCTEEEFSMMAEPSIQAIRERRELLRALASAASVALTGCATAAAASAGHRDLDADNHEEAEVTPGEDLMQEHGVLERVLLVYDEAARRIEHGEEL